RPTPVPSAPPFAAAASQWPDTIAVPGSWGGGVGCLARDAKRGAVQAAGFEPTASANSASGAWLRVVPVHRPQHILTCAGACGRREWLQAPVLVPQSVAAGYPSSSPTVCTRMELVEPDTPGGMPATTTSVSPSWPWPDSLSTTSTWLIMSSVCCTCGTVKVCTPQLSARWLRTCGTGVNASNGIAERNRDMRRAESPDWVKQVRYFTPRVSPICAAPLVITPPRECGVARSLAIRSSPCSSVFSMI